MKVFEWVMNTNAANAACVSLELGLNKKHVGSVAETPRYRVIKAARWPNFFCLSSDCRSITSQPKLSALHHITV